MMHRFRLKPGIAAAPAAAAVLVALASAPALAAADAGTADEQPLGALGRTALVALGGLGAGEAISSVGESLALLAAQQRIRAEAEAEPAAETKPSAEPIPDGTHGEVEIDLDHLPPASAGTNGTKIARHHTNLGREDIFAHTAAADPNNSAILLTGVALAPPHAPEAIKGAINAANTIVGRPYIWGGGHGSFYSHGYDCSGAVSFALFGGGLIPRPLTSGELESWGAPGPGKWITVYANAGHTFATIAGLRWDTVGDAQGTGPRWHLAPTSSDGFVVRHPPGL
jgi:cell wall-associated NlpC family hydrolase